MSDQPACVNATVESGQGPTCCGVKYPHWAGRPLPAGCQLCPDSPSYWRKPAEPQTPAVP